MLAELLIIAGVSIIVGCVDSMKVKDTCDSLDTPICKNNTPIGDFSYKYKQVYSSHDAFACDRDNWLYEGYEIQEVAGGMGYFVYRFEKGFDIFYILISY